MFTRLYFKGFTLIELVMVILLLSVLAAVAIPNFIDMRTDAKNASTKGALGALRSAITIARAAIALKESPNSTPKYPVASEFWENKFKSQSHPVLSGFNIMDPSSGIPKNPWSTSTITAAFHNSVSGLDMCPSGSTPTNRVEWFSDECGTDTANGILLAYGWNYAETSGEIWANSLNNGGAFPAANDFNADCSPSNPREACY